MSKEKPLSIADHVQQWVTIVAVLLVPLVVAYLGYAAQKSAAARSASARAVEAERSASARALEVERSAAAAAQELELKYLEIAIDTLSRRFDDPPDEGQLKLQEWAARILASKSPIALPDGLEASFATSGTLLPNGLSEKAEAYRQRRERWEQRVSHATSISMHLATLRYIWENKPEELKLGKFLDELDERIIKANGEDMRAVFDDEVY